MRKFVYSSFASARVAEEVFKSVSVFCYNVSSLFNVKSVHFGIEFFLIFTDIHF